MTCTKTVSCPDNDTTLSCHMCSGSCPDAWDVTVNGFTYRTLYTGEYVNGDESVYCNPTYQYLCIWAAGTGLSDYFSQDIDLGCPSTEHGDSLIVNFSWASSSTPTGSDTIPIQIYSVFAGGTITEWNTYPSHPTWSSTFCTDTYVVPIVAEGSCGAVGDATLTPVFFTYINETASGGASAAGVATNRVTFNTPSACCDNADCNSPSSYIFASGFVSRTLNFDSSPTSGTFGKWVDNFTPLNYGGCNYVRCILDWIGPTKVHLQLTGLNPGDPYITWISDDPDNAGHCDVIAFEDTVITGGSCTPGVVLAAYASPSNVTENILYLYCGGAYIDNSATVNARYYISVSGGALLGGHAYITAPDYEWVHTYIRRVPAFKHIRPIWPVEPNRDSFQAVNLVGWWTGQGAGLKLIDSSGYGFHALHNDSVTYVASSLSGGPVPSYNGISAVNAVQSIELPDSLTAGTWTITIGSQTTGPIAFNADATTVQASLTALSNIGAAGASVTGDGSTDTPFLVTFQNNLRGINIVLMTADSSLLVPSDDITIDTVTEGVPEGSYTSCAYRSQWNLIQFTIAGWFRTSDKSGNKGIFNKQVSASDCNWSILIWGPDDETHLNGSIVLTATSEHHTAFSLASDFDVCDGEWHHFAAVVNGIDNELNYTRLYVDGVAVDEQGGLRQIDTPEYPVIIGADRGINSDDELPYNDRHFNGEIEDIRIYSAPFTEPMVQQLFNAGSRYDLFDNVSMKKIYHFQHAGAYTESVSGGVLVGGVATVSAVYTKSGCV